MLKTCDRIEHKRLLTHEILKLCTTQKLQEIFLVLLKICTDFDH